LIREDLVEQEDQMKWITREHVKVDRVACPWLIKKFVDKDAEFIFAPADNVMAESNGWMPFLTMSGSSSLATTARSARSKQSSRNTS